MSAAEKLRCLLTEDDRYDIEAYNFIYEALDWTLKHVVTGGERPNQHVAGQELLEGVRQYAIEEFGCLAAAVFEAWGVYTTSDFGEIVFNLVAHDLMGRQDSDSKCDFDNVYEFEEVFDLSPIFSYAADREEWDTAYVTRSAYQPESEVEAKPPSVRG